MVSSVSGFSSTCGTSCRSRSSGRFICKSSSLRRGCGVCELRECESARPSSSCRTRFASTVIFSCRASVLARTNLKSNQPSDVNNPRQVISNYRLPLPVVSEPGVIPVNNSAKDSQEAEGNEQTFRTNGCTTFFDAVARCCIRIMTQKNTAIQ